MKQIFIIANWKSNKTESEAKDWLEKFNIQDAEFTNKEIIVCPPFTLLSSLKSSIENHKSQIKLGAQDISLFDEGAHTGEINGKQIKEFASFVILGHSERRNLGESKEVIDKKIKMAIESGLIPIICISDISQIQDNSPELINSDNKIIVAYEPLFAVGSGNPDTPENAANMAREIKKKLGNVPVLYGGSVNSQNVNEYVKMSEVSGVLVGKASLDPLEFAQIIKNAQ